jgi:hypothetical protein
MNYENIVHKSLSIFFLYNAIIVEKFTLVFFSVLILIVISSDTFEKKMFQFKIYDWNKLAKHNFFSLCFVQYYHEEM